MYPHDELQTSMQRYYGDVGGPPRIGAACPSDPIDCLQNPSNLMCKGPLSLDTLMHSFQMGVGNQLHQLACCCWSTCSQPFSLVVRSWESAAQLLWRTKCFNPSWTLGVRQPHGFGNLCCFCFRVCRQGTLCCLLYGSCDRHCAALVPTLGQNEHGTAAQQPAWPDNFQHWESLSHYHNTCTVLCKDSG